MPQENYYYVTTPLYYVNDKPHVGHAYTTIAADVLARWNRFLGKEVFFLTGTDEHGQKVLDAADKRNCTPLSHADEMTLPFQNLWKRFDIQYDDFKGKSEHCYVVQPEDMEMLRHCLEASRYILGPSFSI